MKATTQQPVIQPATEMLLADYLQEQYGVQAVDINRLGGYSNENYGITTAGGRQYVARVARRNRSAESCRAEAHVLQGLEKAGFHLAPVMRILPGGAPQVAINGKEKQYLHLFDLIPGKIPCLWWQQCSREQLAALFRRLAHLHHCMHQVLPLQKHAPEMVQYTLPDTAPWLAASAVTADYVKQHWAQFVTQTRLLQRDMQKTFPWHKARYQWIHGDVQPENVLFEGDRLTAFLDFEWVSWDACEKDVLFAAFRTCKEGKADDFFQVDETLLHAALLAYKEENKWLCDAFFDHYNTLWKPFFCLDQAMMYLHNAWAGVWELQEGIGFLPCFNEVLTYRPLT